MIAQAIFIIVFLALAVTCLFAEEYCFDRDWMAPCMGFVFIGALFIVSAFVMIGVLGSQVWS